MLSVWYLLQCCVLALFIFCCSERPAVVSFPNLCPPHIAGPSALTISTIWFASCPSQTTYLSRPFVGRKFIYIVTMDLFPSPHQPDEGYSEDPLNPTVSPLQSLPFLLSNSRSPSHLQPWLSSNLPGLPLSVKRRKLFCSMCACSIPRH
jgi:hypothetical protein